MRRKLIVLVTASILLVTQVSSAYAISVITNTLSANDYTINTNQTISFHARTVYGWSVMPNPYSSNFVTEVNAYHFNRPQTYESSGLENPNSWGYFNPGIFTSPAYRYYSGWLWIVPTQTKYLKFTALAKAAASGSRRGHRHGQSTELNWDISWGDPAWVYTTHN